MGIRGDAIVSNMGRRAPRSGVQQEIDGDCGEGV